MGKQAHGEGSVFQREGRKGWIGEFSVNGKRYTVTGKTKPECWQNLRAKRTEIEQGLNLTNWTFERYARWWLEMKKDSYAANTFYNIQLFLESDAIPEFGSKRLSRITHADVQNWLNKKVKDGRLKHSSIRKYLVHLHTIIQYAVKTRMIPFNPCQYAELPSREGKLEKPILTPEQAVQLIERAASVWKKVFTFAIGTAARRNEILAVRWTDINLQTGEWRVTHNFADLPDGLVEGPPKTESSIRTILLPPFVLEMLKEHQHEQKIARVKAGTDWENLDLIFCTETGGFISEDRPNIVFKAILKEIGITGRSFRSLRSSVGSWLYDDGILPQEVQRLLGHSTLAMTTDTYVQRMPGRAKKTMARLDEIVKEASQDEEKRNNLG